MINTLEIILPTEKTKQKIPYINNFLYNSEITSINFDKLAIFLEEQKQNNNLFLNLIISSNNDISQSPIETIRSLMNCINPYLFLFKHKYVYTNGDLLKGAYTSKFLTFKKDFLIRIPRYSINDNIDANFFENYYIPNINLYYPSFASFQQAKICFEIICLNDTSQKSLIEIIDGLINKYRQTEEFYIRTVKIYGNYINSSNIRDIPFSNWILNFCYKDKISNDKHINLDQEILNNLDIITSQSRLEFKEYSEWFYKNKKIIFNKPSNLQIRNQRNIYLYYGDSFIDYEGSKLEI